MKRTLSTAVPAVLAIALALFPVTSRADFEVGARGIYWFPDLDAKVQTFDAVTGTKVDAKNDLGVEDEDAPGVEAYVRLGSFTVRAGYTALEYDGSKRIQDNIVFHGRTYPVGDNVVSRIDLKMADLDLQYDLLRQSLVAAKVNLGLMFRLKYVDGKVMLRNATAVEEKTFRAPVPMLGVVAGVGLLRDIVRVDARAAGVAYSGNRLFEGDAYASIHPFPLLYLQGGYRIIDLKVDESDIEAKIRLKGPYAGVQLSF